MEAVLNAASFLQLIPLRGQTITGKDEIIFVQVDDVKKSLEDYEKRCQQAFNLTQILDSSVPDDVKVNTESSEMDQTESSNDAETASPLLSSCSDDPPLLQFEPSKKQVKVKQTKFSCDKCQKEFHARRNLYFHERQVHDVKKTCCPDCGKPLRNHATLIRHRRTHYGVHEMVHICPECGKRCKERRHLVIHCSNVGHPVPPESIMNSNPFGLNFREILRDDGSMKFLP